MSNYGITPNSANGVPMFNTIADLSMGGGMTYTPRPMKGPKRPHECDGHVADGSRCTAPKAKGGELCIGHQRSVKKAERLAAEEVTD